MKRPANKTYKTFKRQLKGRMNFKAALIYIIIVASAVLVTFAVQEIRFKATMETLWNKNQTLEARNDQLTQQIEDLNTQMAVRIQNFEETLRETHQTTLALRGEVASLEQKNQYLESKNEELTQQMRTLKARLAKERKKDLE